ncbi:MAG: hypothetical protein LIP16_12575 [Clostridium sp.]|nr:hypothetical protein [Clostridium sp.]
MNNESVRADNKLKEEAGHYEELYYFIQASLNALQAAGGYGKTSFTCPVCGGKAYAMREKKAFYNTGAIECGCGYSFYY